MRTYNKSFGSNSKSSHEPRDGITRALNNSLREAWVLPPSWSKMTPGERCNCDTTTRSAPLMTKVPLSVISGMSPRKTSCDSRASLTLRLLPPLLKMTKRMVAYSGQP